MAEKEECAAAETKKIINPRAEIDTAPPFESVKEAVDRFGGRGPWIPHHLLRLPPPCHDPEDLDVNKMEEQALKFERDLIVKEQEALNVLKEVEAAKRFVEGLKVNLMEDLSSGCKCSNGNVFPVQSPGYVLMELNRAKLDLNKMSVDLTVVRSSVESLNKKVRDERVILDKHGEGNFESEQFKKMAEASRYEVMKAMSEIERTKASIKMAEMRLGAAKKMEEAAKAVEAIAFAAKKNSPEGITLSHEDYFALTRKAQRAEDLCNTRKKVEENIDTQRNKDNEHVYKSHEDYFALTRKAQRAEDLCNTRKKVEENVDTQRNKDNEHVYKSSISIGDVLSRKLILRDDIVASHTTTERKHVSFSQMLREQSGIILNPGNSAKDGSSVRKQYITQRKKFGFIHVPLPKQNKKKAQPVNFV